MLPLVNAIAYGMSRHNQVNVNSLSARYGIPLCDVEAVREQLIRIIEKE
jgi:hypothetical protein